jgi:hypothetical protein
MARPRKKPSLQNLVRDVEEDLAREQAAAMVRLSAQSRMALWMRTVALAAATELRQVEPLLPMIGDDASQCRR